jgi:hypothetical protein
MKYAVDLSERQSARTLEQAVRHRAMIIVEPRVWLDMEGIKGRIIDLDDADAIIEITEDPLTALDVIVGTYCDGSVLLGRDQYLFSTNITSVGIEGKHWHVRLARPIRLQVQQRRRYWRVELAQSSKVELRHGEPARAIGAGMLCNISGEGLACLVDVPLAEQIGIGDTVYTSFSLPDSDRTFELAGILCNKTPASQPDRTIIGMQFLEPASSGTAGPARDLHAVLLERYGPGVAASAHLDVALKGATS